MSFSDVKKAPIQVHSSTLPHLDFVEKIILDSLVKQGRAVVIDEQREVKKW